MLTIRSAGDTGTPGKNYNVRCPLSVASLLLNTHKVEILTDIQGRFF